MELLTGILLFLLGVISGVTIVVARNKWDPSVQQTQSELKQCQQDQAQLRQDWQDQIAQFKTFATSLNELSRHINANVREAEQLVQVKSESPAFPFFSKEATEFLQQTDSKPRNRSKLSDQPLDYSDSQSGVFHGVPRKEPEKTN